MGHVRTKVNFFFIFQNNNQGTFLMLFFKLKIQYDDSIPRHKYGIITFAFAKQHYYFTKQESIKFLISGLKIGFSIV